MPSNILNILGLCVWKDCLKYHILDKCGNRLDWFNLNQMVLDKNVGQDIGGPGGEDRAEPILSWQERKTLQEILNVSVTLTRYNTHRLKVFMVFICWDFLRFLDSESEHFSSWPCWQSADTLCWNLWCRWVFSCIGVWRIITFQISAACLRMTAVFLGRITMICYWKLREIKPLQTRSSSSKRSFEASKTGVL